MTHWFRAPGRPWAEDVSPVVLRKGVEEIQLFDSNSSATASLRWWPGATFLYVFSSPGGTAPGGRCKFVAFLFWQSTGQWNSKWEHQPDSGNQLREKIEAGESVLILSKTWFLELSPPPPPHRTGSTDHRKPGADGGPTETTVGALLPGVSADHSCAASAGLDGDKRMSVEWGGWPMLIRRSAGASPGFGVPPGRLGAEAQAPCGERESSRLLSVAPGPLCPQP